MRNKKTLGNSLRSYFSKPANLITIVFLIVLLLTVVLPLSTLLIGSFKVNGNQEAIWIDQEGVEDGSWTFHHWIELLTSKEYNYASTKFWVPNGQMRTVQSEKHTAIRCRSSIAIRKGCSTWSIVFFTI